MLACQTGLRVTELTTLTTADVHLGTGAHVSCLGKGSKQRITPLTPATVTVLRSWLAERGGLPADPLFITRRGTRSAATRRNGGSPSTPRPPQSRAGRCWRRRYRPMSCGIMWMAGLCGWQQHLRW